MIFTASSDYIHAQFSPIQLTVFNFAVSSNKILKSNYILLRAFIPGFYVYEFDHNQCTLNLT